MLPTLLALAFAPRTPTPPVCITVPTNGRPEFLPHALRMISEQNYAGAIHVVVVDDSPASGHDWIFMGGAAKTARRMVTTIKATAPKKPRSTSGRRGPPYAMKMPTYAK